MTDDFAAVDVCLQLAMTELVFVVWPLKLLKGMVPSWQLHPVAAHNIMVNHEPQSKEHIALKGCECA